MLFYNQFEVLIGTVVSEVSDLGVKHVVSAGRSVAPFPRSAIVVSPGQCKNSSDRSLLMNTPRVLAVGTTPPSKHIPFSVLITDNILIQVHSLKEG